MAQIELSNDIILNISKIKDEDCQFLSLEVSESIFGELPTAKLRVRCDHDVVKLLDEITIKIDNQEDYTIEGKFYVYSISYLMNICDISLMAGNPNFTRKILSNKFTNIRNAVNSLYYGDIISNTDPDILNDIEIFQINCTDYKLLTRLLPAWKKDTIYGYSFDGLRIHDLKSFQMKWDDFARKAELSSLDPPELTEPKLYTSETKFIDYSQSEDPNHSYIYYDKQYIPVNNSYRDLLSNYIHNTQFKTTKNTCNVSTRILVPVAITDGIKVEDKDATIKKIFISSRIMKLEVNTIKVDYTFKSIDPL